MKRWLLYIAAAWAFLALTWWVCERLLMSDEKRVLLQVETLARLVESGNLFTLDDAIAADYRDDWENDKRTLMLAVRALRQRYRDLEIHLGRAIVRASGDTATADLRARVTGRADGDTQTEGERGEYRLTFRRVEKEWKLSRVARKEPAP
ncbi:MAG: nuclear transport factor 2 family protein [Verrucomicrobia bacterium]|nr:nuclear transport factor 2 family protein [Verrucomicrobiota bacterium]